jgi:hypothetical protein
MKTSRLISGLVLALSLSVAPAIANEPTPVVATSAEVQSVTDAANEAKDAASAAIDAARLAKDAADAATAAAQDALAAAEAANTAIAKLKSDFDSFAVSMRASITTLAATMAKIAKKLKA